MKSLISKALKFENNALYVLNQQKLPTEIEWIHCHSPMQMVEIIQSLKVRGAPLIGIAAALALADFVEKKKPTREEIITIANLLINARPTAVNLSYCIEQQLQAYHASNDMQAIVHTAEQLFEEDAKLTYAMAEHGAKLIQDGETILTHCNTGALVTTGIGTALGVIIFAHQQGKNIHVYVDETRPLLQGARLTAWELEQAGIPYTLICDNMAAYSMKMGRIDRVMTGADRIAINGDVANKIGTYGLAVHAHYHNIPFHIVAPETTIDWQCQNGESIRIEERAHQEVRGAIGAFGQVTWSPEQSHVYNPAFDVTPAGLITSYILSRGIVKSIDKTLLAVA